MVRGGGACCFFFRKKSSAKKRTKGEGPKGEGMALVWEMPGMGGLVRVREVSIRV